MAKTLAWVAIIALILTLGSTLLTIRAQLEPPEEMLKFTRLLLSRQAIAVGPAVGGNDIFKKDMKDLLTRIARQQ